MWFARKVIASCFLLLGFTFACSGESMRWAKGATHFGSECPPAKGDTCTLARVPSPDHRLSVVVRRTREEINFAVIRGAQRSQFAAPTELHQEVDWFTGMEVLWAPDSSAFSLAWSENAITNMSRIYVVKEGRPVAVDLAAVRADLVKDYPACVGVPDHCVVSRDGKDYNYLTVGWAAPHTVAIMGEVGESSSFGRTLGKVNGYEVDAASGKIVRVLKPGAFKRRWQSHMGWTFSVSNAMGVQ
jgi:hypothetical protein